MTLRDECLLDNPVWHALQGPLSRFALPAVGEDLVQFDHDVSPFSAIDIPDDSSWGKVAEEVGREGFCGLFRADLPELPSGWEEHYRGSCLQMVAGDLPPAQNPGIEVLQPADATDALALAELTEPGPFLLRTPELGRFVGVRRDGELVAMAGERFRVPGFVEISAVCALPKMRGQGLAAALTLNVAESIRAGGDEAFLHVLVENENAIRLYQKLGFVTRCELDVVFAQWHGAEWVPSERNESV